MRTAGIVGVGLSLCLVLSGVTGCKSHDGPSKDPAAIKAQQELMARRTKRAEDKIAAAERAAIAEVRALAAETASKAAALVIAEKLDADADRAMIDRSIAGLGRPN